MVDILWISTPSGNQLCHGLRLSRTLGAGDRPGHCLVHTGLDDIRFIHLYRSACDDDDEEEEEEDEEEEDKEEEEEEKDECTV